jgi:hypothetical protein
LKILEWEVAHPQGERGVCIKWYQSVIFIADNRERREETKEIV